MRCSTGKRCFAGESVALEALIQNHIINDYLPNEGPVNVYECHQCGYWHFTSKGLKNAIFKDADTLKRIQQERRANYWERKLK